MTGVGCGRARSISSHDNTASLEQLRVRHCPLTKHPAWRTRVKSAVEAEIARARTEGLRFAEVGGWAIAKERRSTCEGLMIALATFGLSQMLGGAFVLTTANVAHSCSSILRRLGGSFLEHEGTPIPTYFDQRYNTEIDLLRFDSRYPSTRYAHLVRLVMEKLQTVSIVASGLENACEGYRPVQKISYLRDYAQPMFAA